MIHILRKVLLTVLALAGLAMGLLLSGPSSAVNWTGLRAVVLESDDWGLPGFIPAADAWQGIEPTDIGPGRFPAVYWYSTLEDSAMVAELCTLLARFRGADGLPAVFQPNYVMTSLDLVPGPDREVWQQVVYPDLPTAYPRPGLQQAVRQGMALGVWYPEFHATLHYDPARRLESALSTETAALATRRGIMLFPGSEVARELGPWRDLQDLERELDLSLRAFAAAFGRPVGAVVAPDYTWNARIEDMWESRGLLTIQGKREQRNPDLGHGPAGRVAKFVSRALDRWFHPDRQYLERNCRLEPVQAPAGDPVVAVCVQDAQAAWRRGQPAIVETHRINFAHTDPAVVRKGQAALADFLAALTSADGPGPLFLTDVEVAQLNCQGVSVVQRGQRVILRNGTRSARLVDVANLPRFTASAGENAVPVKTFYLLKAGQTLVL